METLTSIQRYTTKYYYALICDKTLICGIYSQKEEAVAANEGVKDCPLKHTIKKCTVVITLT